MSLVTFVAGTVLEAADLNDSFTAVNVIKAVGSATVATSQTTTSTSFTDLSTAGPSVTLTTGTDVLITLCHSGIGTNAGQENIMSVAVSGASTVAAADANSAQIGAISADGSTSVTFKLTGLTAGSNTFTAKYRTSAGATTSTFFNRHITVMAL